MQSACIFIYFVNAILICQSISISFLLFIIVYVGDCRVIGFNFICVRVWLEYYLLLFFGSSCCCFACSVRLLIFIKLQSEHVESTYLLWKPKINFFFVTWIEVIGCRQTKPIYNQKSNHGT